MHAGLSKPYDHAVVTDLRLQLAVCASCTVTMTTDRLHTTMTHCSQSVISGMHYYECVAPNVQTSFSRVDDSEPRQLLRCSFRERFNDSRSCWVVFIHVVRGVPVVFSSSPRGKLLRSAWHLIRLEFMQCGRTRRDTVLEQQPKDFLSWS